MSCCPSSYRLAIHLFCLFKNIAHLAFPHSVEVSKATLNHKLKLENNSILRKEIITEQVGKIKSENSISQKKDIKYGSIFFSLHLECLQRRGAPCMLW